MKIETCEQWYYATNKKLSFAILQQHCSFKGNQVELTPVDNNCCETVEGKRCKIY